MQRMRLVRYNFDFESTYNKLLRDTMSIRGADRSKYHYLDNRDLFHDTLEETFKYLKNEGEVTRDSFVRVFGTILRFMRKRMFDKRNPRATEYKRRAELEDYMHPKNYMVDLDLKDAMMSVEDKYPSVKKIISGYTLEEAGAEEGISRRGYKYRYDKELSQLKKEYSYE